MLRNIAILMYRVFSKSVIDLLVACVALLFISPLFLLVTFLLAWANRGSVFFLQSRPGYKEKAFTVIKFKTMNDRMDENGSLLPDKERLTKIGRFIRKTSLDELPQLINVLKGEMSLIGPRPLLFKYLPLYNETQRRRHDVRPGITGWAQVNGRNSISWSQKFSFDIYYVDNLSFMLDLQIAYLTILKVIKREGVNQSAERPMQPFTGNN